MLVSHKVIGSMLIMVSIACVVILIIGGLGRDKNAPEISFSEENGIVYGPDEPKSRLLEDVTAFDREDGEVTDNLVIEGVYDFNNGTAKVVYVARDRSGNIAKAERMITYVKAEAPATPAAVDAFAGNENSGEEPEEDGELLPNGSRPALRLKVSKVIVKKGDSSFDEIGYVDEVVDDKDSREQLFRRISVKGECNVNQVGTYKLGFRVTDSDGNVSEEETLTVVVE